MFQKVLSILIIGMFVIAVGMKLIEATQTTSSVQNTQIIVPSLSASTPQTILQLFPNPALPDSEGNIAIAVSMDTKGNMVSDVSFTLKYDPTALRFVSIAPEDSYYNAEVIAKKVDQTNGTILYELALPKRQVTQAFHGKDHIAEIEFAPKHAGQTRIQFLSGVVQGVGLAKSVLQDMKDTVAVVKSHY